MVFQIYVKVQLVILVFMANLQSFPNNFGNLSKFSITSYDSAANSATNTALSNNATSSDGSGGLTNTTSNRIDGLNVCNWYRISRKCRYWEWI